MAENSIQKATYKSEECAQILNVSIRKMYSICEGDNPPFKVLRLGKRCLRIHKKSFDEWFDGLADEN